MRKDTHMRKITHNAPEANLTRRERQIMDVVFARGEASAREIWEQVPDAPTYSTIRTLLAVLEEKGHLVRRSEGKALVYRPRRQREKAAASALQRLLATFFQGSVEQAVAGLLELEENLSDEELARIGRLIAEARKNKKP
jgi:BlaI family transcriptional regulator, penicillinase repressor